MNSNMINNRTRTSKTLFRSQHKDENDHDIVIACGYNTDGKFGYFIVSEHVEDGDVVYTNPLFFIEKKHERTYQEVLNKLKDIIL